MILSGHGGPVRRAFLLPQSPDLIVSGSYDQNVHVWNLKTYLESRDWLVDPTKAKFGRGTAQCREPFSKSPRIGSETVATFARTWANPPDSHVLANVATGGSEL